MVFFFVFCFFFSYFVLIVSMCRRFLIYFIPFQSNSVIIFIKETFCHGYYAWVCTPPSLWWEWYSQFVIWIVTLNRWYDYPIALFCAFSSTQWTFLCPAFIAAIGRSYYKVFILVLSHLFFFWERFSWKLLDVCWNGSLHMLRFLFIRTSICISEVAFLNAFCDNS